MLYSIYDYKQHVMIITYIPYYSSRVYCDDELIIKSNSEFSCGETEFELFNPEQPNRYPTIYLVHY